MITPFNFEFPPSLSRNSYHEIDYNMILAVEQAKNENLPLLIGFFSAPLEDLSGPTYAC